MAKAKQKTKLTKVDLGAPNSRGGYLYLAMMDVAPEHEEEFHDLYNNDHVAALSKVPGLRSVARFQLISSTRENEMPRFLAAYVLEKPDLREGKAWKKASASGNWRSRMSPLTFSKEAHLWRLLDVTEKKPAKKAAKKPVKKTAKTAAAKASVAKTTAKKK